MFGTFIRPYSGRLALIGTLAAAEVGLAALAPWPMKIVVDNVLSGRALQGRAGSIAGALGAPAGGRLLGLVLLIGLAIQILSELVDGAGTRLRDRTSEQITFDVRVRLFGHLQALGLRHHARFGSGDALYRIASDAPFASTLVFSAVLPLAAAVLTLGAMLVILARVDRTLAAIAMGAVPFLFWLVRLELKPLADRAGRIKMLESKLADRIHQSFAGIRLVKAFGRERHEAARFHRHAADGIEARLGLARQQSTFSFAIAAIAAAGTTAVLWVGGLHVLDGRLSVGALLVVVVYLGAVYRPLSVIAHTAGTVQEALASGRRVEEALALEPEFLESATDRMPRPADSASPGHVVFSHVTFSYEGRAEALHDVSFAAAPGELVALVGLTGAGKSTAAALVPRFYDATHGVVRVDGQDVRDHDLRSLRERVALVLQEPLLFAGTIAENIRYGRPDASDEEVRAAAAAAEAAFIEELPGGYDTRIEETGGGLSGGQRQQICLARALLKTAPILVLDEPTSSLDAPTEARVFATLRRQRERTTIVIAHRLSSVVDADRIIVFDGGRVVANGRHEDVLATSEVYRLMWERFCAS